MRRSTSIVVSLIPLLLTPVLGWLIAEDYLSFGGGEKDLILVFPWIVWAVCFAVAFSVAARKGLSLGPSVRRGAGWATGLLLGAWFILYFLNIDWLGM
jgi:hypothetical protein